MFRVQNWVIRVRISTLPAPVGLVPEKVLEIRGKQFLATLSTNYKNYSPNNVGMFSVHNRVIRAQLWVDSRPIHCLAVLMGNDNNCTRKSVGMFRALNHFAPGPIFNFACSCVPGLGKVVKIRSKHFSTILTKNNNNCTTNYIGMFRVQNWVVRVWISTLPAPVGLVPEKVVKIRCKQFSATLTTNYKNCTPNSVGMLPVQNWVIRAQLLTEPAPGLLWSYTGMEKSSILDRNIL